MKTSLKYVTIVLSAYEIAHAPESFRDYMREFKPPFTMDFEMRKNIPAMAYGRFDYGRINCETNEKGVRESIKWCDHNSVYMFRESTFPGFRVSSLGQLISVVFPWSEDLEKALCKNPAPPTKSSEEKLVDEYDSQIKILKESLFWIAGANDEGSETARRAQDAIDRYMELQNQQIKRTHNL